MQNEPWAVRPPARRRRVAWRALLGLWCAGAAIAGIVALELFSRKVAPDYLVRTRGYHVFSDTYGWQSRRGVSLLSGGKRVTFNRRGYRGRELPLPRRDRHVRAIVLGDSIAFGLGVADHETFTSLLDRRDNGIEAANLSVLGYGPDQELLLLLHEGLRYHPDVVVLAVCLANDFAEAMLPVSLYDGGTAKPRFEVVGHALRLDRSPLEQSSPARLRQWLSDHSLLYNLAAWQAPAPAPAGQHWRQRRDEALRDEDRALRLSLALVTRMAELCRERGITFLVAAFPDRFSFRRTPGLAARYLRALAGREIAVIDMSTHFRQVGSRLKAVALDGTGHLSPVGHEVTAAVLEREISAREPGVRRVR
jgi:hypothetical protein